MHSAWASPVAHTRTHTVCATGACSCPNASLHACRSAPRPTLLPELVQKLEAGGDVATLSGVLATANSIFKRCA